MIAFLLAWPVLICAQQWPDEFRTVDGKLYDVRYSTNWASLFILLDRENGGTIGLIKANRFVDDYVICDVYCLDNSFAKQVAVRNLARTGITSGDYVTAPKDHVMKIKNVQIGNQVLEAFDYGVAAEPPKPIQPPKPTNPTNSAPSA